MNLPENNMNVPPLDPRLDSVLDRMLAPAPLPPGLVERIMARTTGALEAAPLGVLARIDRLYRWPRAVAATVVAAALVGILFSATRIFTGAHTTVVVNRELGVVNRELAALPAYKLPIDATPIDATADMQMVDQAAHRYNSDLDSVETDLNQGLEQLEKPAGGEALPGTF